MRKFIIRRIVQNVITFFIFLTAIYFLLDAQPGDFGNIYASDPRLTADQRAALRARYGLDKPVHERYFIWLGNALRGDLGVSFSLASRPVIDVIKERAPRTITLFLTSTVVSFYIGFMMGKILAWKRGGFIEYLATVGGVTLYTIFLPWFGLMMIFLFSYTLGWFPLGKFNDVILWRRAPVDANEIFNGMLLTALVAAVALFVLALVTRRLNPSARRPAMLVGTGAVFAVLIGYWYSTGHGVYVVDILSHLILPIMTLAIVNFSGVMLLTRNSMLETLREDYIMAARAKGLPDKVVRDKHAARNAMLPVATSFVLALAFVLDGGVITESVFSWPGMGLTLLNAAQTQDIPMVIGALVFTGFLALTGHLLADILYAYLDPRIRYS